MMVAIDQVFEASSKAGVDNAVIGMPHRWALP
jgi:2-oxoglutarate dehydrogenase complex dehydrogenase (E1) component-like enzyme